MTIWSPVMFRDETDMLQMRLEELAPYDVRTVLVESAVTHRGVPKPLHYQDNAGLFARWADSIHHVVASLPDAQNPWVREHAQRNAAWPVIDANAQPGDTVLICDLDEIPSLSLLNWQEATGNRYTAVAARMRTCLFAVDWEVPDEALPPTCVASTPGWLRGQAVRGRGLGEVRDRRGDYPVLADGGWHFSWIGGPARQREKLETATCHTEVIGTPEGEMIRDGTRWRTGEHGQGYLPVVPVEVDESWPAFIRERRCPPDWFRPREEAACAR
jgi:hypothetical protein